VSPSDPVWNQRVVLVTGYSGFLGLWLVSRLSSESARVIGLSRSRIPAGKDTHELQNDRFTPVQCDIADEARLLRILLDYNVDTIFHLAAQSKADDAQQNPRDTFERNIGGTWTLLEAVRHSGRPIRVVLASTESVSAEFASAAPSSSDPFEITGMAPYPASKACAEVLAKCYHQTYGVRISIARTSNLYGGGDLGFQRIIPGTIRSVLRNTPPVIHGNGMALRDYLYVEDAVTGYLLLASATEAAGTVGHSFNFTGEASVRVLAIVETILRLMGRTDLQPRILNQGPEEKPVQHDAALKAREHLGWVAQWSMEAGLQKTIEWYRSHADEFRAEAQQ
jgi:CDP-glucose 4,6-dehydratase